MGGTGGHRRNAGQGKTGQRSAIRHQLALTLHHVDGHRSLTILEGGELLSAGHRYGGIARDHLLGEPPHGLKTQGKRDDVQQQHLGIWFVAHQNISLNGSADGHHLVGIDTGERRATKELAHHLAHQRHPGGAPHHHHLQHFHLLETRIAQGATASQQSAFHQRSDELIKLAAAHRALPTGKGAGNAVSIGQTVFDGGSHIQQLALQTGIQLAGQTGFFFNPVSQQVIEIIATEGGITAGRHHFEYTAVQTQN